MRPPLDLARARSVAVEAAEAAGALLRAGQNGALGVRPKGSDGDVVTDLDLAAERLILDRIRAVFPEHQVIAEESGTVGPGRHSCVWLVDPLDGTNNVAIGLPVYAVGIALCRDGQPVLGVVHNPVTGRTWSAVRNGGAPAGCEERMPAGRPVPAHPRLAWIQGHGVPRHDTRARALRMVLEARSHRLLQLWAPLLAWVMLADGHIDGIVGYRTELVDLPAGAIIAVEAGLSVCGLDGKPFDHRIDLPARDRSFVAARPGLVAPLLENVELAGRLEASLDGLL
ncbi:MAG: Inositol-phosphate phosphatase [Streptosporangiaceae bacterium]|nr:Inositol-phosphate phosphatase [Streptosporangiaceae bacterium]